MNIFSTIFSNERRARSVLAIFCFLSALEGGILSITLVRNFRSQSSSASGFTTRQLVLLAVCTIVIAGLIWIGAMVFRRPEFIQKWLTWLRKPAFYKGAAHALAFLILSCWVIVFGWKGMLDQVIPIYGPLYDRYSSLILWILLIGVQAGLFLWLSGLSQPEPGKEIKAGFQKSGYRSLLLEVTAILFALLLYSLFLRVQLPNPVSASVRYDLLLLSLPALFGLYFAFRHSGWIADLIGLSAVLSLASLALAYLWTSGTSEEFIIMGLFPYTDASSLYTDSQLLLNGFSITSWGGRPIFSLFFAVLLRLTGSNLQAAIAIMVAITMMCCYFAAREVNRNFGPAAAAFTMYLMFIYYRQFIGSTLTESLGLAFGALSLAFLLQGARTRNFWITLFGLFLAALALNVRPGPLFILPLLVLWFTFTFRRSNTFIASARPFLISSGVILLAFAFNLLMIKSMSSAGAAIFSRFPPTFYGLAVGGKNWVQIYNDHPFVDKLPDNQQASTIYAFAFDEIRANPIRFLKGIEKFFLDFFSPQWGAFAFIHDEMNIRSALYCLSFFGIIYLSIKRKDARSSLLLAGVVGILLSTPFVPPRDSNWMRTYGAVIPFIVIIPSLSLALFNLRVKIVQKEDLPEAANTLGSEYLAFRSPSFILTAVLVASVMVGPFVVKAITQKPAIPQANCTAPDKAFSIRINPGSYIQVVADDAPQASHLPDLSISNLIHSVKSFGYQNIFAEQPYQPGMTILNTLNLASRERIWIAVPSAGLPVDGSIVQVCGHKKDGSIFVFADGFTPAGK